MKGQHNRPYLRRQHQRILDQFAGRVLVVAEASGGVVEQVRGVDVFVHGVADDAGGEGVERDEGCDFAC